MDEMSVNIPLNLVVGEDECEQYLKEGRRLRIFFSIVLLIIAVKVGVLLYPVGSLKIVGGIVGLVACAYALGIIRGGKDLLNKRGWC